MALAGVTEAVTVAAEASPIVNNPVVGANFRKEEVDGLPLGRTPQNIAELSPGLTDNTPNAGQLSISGGFAFDNVFLVDGVDVNDNIFATANNLYIEDAVDETQVLTSGISAEYGRFSGGVVNLVTKRGGDRFSGSYRANFSNPSWVDETPFETTRAARRSAAGARGHARRTDLSASASGSSSRAAPRTPRPRTTSSTPAFPARRASTRSASTSRSRRPSPTTTRSRAASSTTT